MVRLTAALISALNDGADLATIQTLSVPNRDFDQVLTFLPADYNFQDARFAQGIICLSMNVQHRNVGLGYGLKGCGRSSGHSTAVLPRCVEDAGNGT